MSKYFVLRKSYLVLLLIVLYPGAYAQLPQGVRISTDGINGAILSRNGKTLVVYGDPAHELRRAEMVLFTHFRRDVVWAGRQLVNSGATAVIPAAQEMFFLKGDSLWREIARRQFREHSNRTTKIPVQSWKNVRRVSDGDVIHWQDLSIRVISTTGNTYGAVSYVTDIDGKRIAFVGDLIYGDGQLFDLYSYQDSLKGGIDGNHGYAVRLGHLLKSLQRIASEKPDLLVPVRGGIITDPAAAIQKLTERIQRLYNNYLSITAQRWNHMDRMIALSKHVLGQSAVVDWMPFSTVIQNNPPPWYKHLNCGNIVISDDSSALLIDCGTGKDFLDVLTLKKRGRIKRVDGIFISHYHYDHTDFVKQAVETFGCNVYITKELKDILANPGAYHMPSMTPEGIPNLTVLREGETVSWKEFILTFSFFPGQTLYHDGLLMEKNNGQAIFFTGDSFTPAGIDDYCFQNRNILAEDAGYLRCIDLLKTLPGHVLLSNEHIKPLFRFSPQQLDHMASVLRERMTIMKELMPWDNINYGNDDQWAWVYPYGQKAKAGETITCSVRVNNYSDKPKTFRITPTPPPGFKVLDGPESITIEPGKEGMCTYRLKVPDKVSQGTFVFLADIAFDQWTLREWTESFIEVTP